MDSQTEVWRVFRKKKKRDMKEHKLRPVWRGMKNRCFNSKAPKFKYYGARGITVCDEWKENYQAFFDWAMANGYEEGLTLDRIDTNGNYEPSNCRWVTKTVQNGNKRNNRYLEFQGVTRSIPEWSAITGIPTPIIYGRIHYHGWSVERALTTKRG